MEGKSYVKLLIILLKYVKDRNDWIERSLISSSQSNKNNKTSKAKKQKEEANLFLQMSTSPFDMLDWLPEELIFAMVPPTVDSIHFYQSEGGAGEGATTMNAKGESFTDAIFQQQLETTDQQQDADQKKNKKRKSKLNKILLQHLRERNMLKINISYWKEYFEKVETKNNNNSDNQQEENLTHLLQYSNNALVIPIDDYYLQLWSQWNREYLASQMLRNERNKTKEITRLKRNVVAVMKEKVRKEKEDKFKNF